jgi:hypothetical protein
MKRNHIVLFISAIAVHHDASDVEPAFSSLDNYGGRSGIRCTGKRLGLYSWSGPEQTFLHFLTSDEGREWGCGDITINIGDYSDPYTIYNAESIVPFILAYRALVLNEEAVVWLSYGDTVSRDGTLMEAFIDTFFSWAASISEDQISGLGKIGITFDVEHMAPEATRSALMLAQSLKDTTSFPFGKLLIQHTIEGRPNPEGTDYVMRYADSALVMLYRNYMQSPIFSEDSNLLRRAEYFLRMQCENCLNDEYATEHYNAKLTVMVEASCGPMDYCAKVSFCAHGGQTEGAHYLWEALQQLQSEMLEAGLVTDSQFSRLFNPWTTYSVHDWGWFRCYPPFTGSLEFEQCQRFAMSSEQCRSTRGEIPTTPPIVDEHCGF